MPAPSRTIRPEERAAEAPRFHQSPVFREANRIIYHLLYPDICENDALEFETLTRIEVIFHDIQNRKLLEMLL